MECLLHYVWQNGLFSQTDLRTTDGRRVEIVRRGTYNRDAGPDFLGAQVRIDGQMWVGDVEIHDAPKDWTAHRHDTNRAYNTVVLHVVAQEGCAVRTEAGAVVPQLIIAIPEWVQAGYDRLRAAEEYPPCHAALQKMDRLALHAYLNALTVERLEMKTARIKKYLDLTAGDWERTLFIALARSFGFGLNGDAFEQWALAVRPSDLAKHRDDPVLIEAYFLGMAGLLDEAAVEAKHRDEAYRRLARDFHFLRTKFSLTPLSPTLWRFLRLRPQGFPHLRLSQLTDLYCRGRCTLRHLLEANTLAAVHSLLHAEATPYWQSHYRFDRPCRSGNRVLRRASLDRLVVNTVVPLLFAYGRAHGRDELCERAFAFLEATKAEDDRIARSWAMAGLRSESAADTQALNHLYTAYCTERRCLDCRIGREYIHSIS